jgi:hypothetical protein
VRPCQHPALVRGSGEHVFQGIRLICGIYLAPQEIQAFPLVDLGRVPQDSPGPGRCRATIEQPRECPVRKCRPSLVTTVTALAFAQVSAGAPTPAA